MIASAPPVAQARSRRFDFSGAVFAAALVLVCGLTVFTGLAPMRLLEHDNFFLLDNAYRVAQGQVPHRDFSSAWGPVIYLADATGLFLSGMRPAGLAYANALFGALIGVWAYRIGRARLVSLSACWMGVYTLLLIAAPFSLGYLPLLFSEAMVYNRYGFALLGIILVECGAHALGTGTGARDQTKGAISSGAAFAILAFLKVTFAIVAVPFLLLSLVRGPGRNHRLFTLCAASALVLFLFSCYLRFDFRDLLQDLAMAANARGRSWSPGAIPGLAFGKEGMPLVFLVAAVTLAKYTLSEVRSRETPLADAHGPDRRSPDPSRDREGAMEARLGSKWPVRELLMALLTLGVGGALLSSNNQPGTMPLNVFVALLLADSSLVRLRWGARPGLSTLAVALLLAMCALPAGMLDALSVAAAARASRRPDARAVRLATERGASMIFAPVRSLEITETGGPAYVRTLNDGIALLRRHTQAPDGVLTIDMVNPFNYLLGRHSPRGGIAAGAYNYVFSDAAHLSDDRFFGDARYVLVRKYSRDAGDFATEQYHIEGLLRIYRAALDGRFGLLEETPHWQLYGLRQAAPKRTL